MAAIFCKRPRLLRQSIVLLHENARHYTPNLTAVYGCTSDMLWISPNLVLSVLYLTESLRSTWVASDCNRCWCEASYHLLATDTQQQCLTLEHKPWYCTICFMWSVYWSESQLHSHMRLCVTLFFESSMYIQCSVSRWVHKYWILWMVGFLSFADNFYNELFVLVMTFTLLCPHNFVTCLT